MNDWRAVWQSINIRYPKGEDFCALAEIPYTSGAISQDELQKCESKRLNCYEGYFLGYSGNI